ncbi:MAG: LysR family transcriptional regulator, partial [Cellvibrionaceae bacterium]
MNKNIPTEFLRSFVTIAELGSFTQAGDKLARSQSAISLQIKKLEELLGQQVFSRKGHNFELTHSGEILMRYATQILQLNDRVLGELDSKAIVGKVRLGIPSEFAISLLPKIVGNFSRQNPQITLEVICDLSRNLNNDLKQRKYDLILSILDDPDQIEGHYVKRDQLVWVSASEHFSHDTDSIPLIVAPEGCIYRNRAIKHLKNANI